MCLKMDLAMNNLQWFISNKTKPNLTKSCVWVSLKYSNQSCGQKSPDFSSDLAFFLSLFQPLSNHLTFFLGTEPANRVIF